MKVVDHRTTRKDNNINQTTNIINDQNSMSIIKKIITKSKLYQIKTKTKQFDLYFIRKYMRPVSNAICYQFEKKANRCEVQKYFSIFENN